VTRQRVFFCVLMLLSAGGMVAAEEEEKEKEKAAAGGRAEPLKVLYYTETLGYKHSVVVRPADGSLSHSERVLKDIAEKSGAYAISFSQTCQDLAPERLKGLDVLVVYCCDMPPFSEEQKKGLLDFVRGGGGFVGIHGATIVWYGWPGIGVMMGAFFDNHPWNANAAAVTIKIEQPTHPVVRMFGESLRIQDEIYQFKEPYDRSKTHVLMSLDTNKTDMTVPGVHRKDGDFALAWWHEYGKGRVVYSALGHREDVWTNPQVQQHFLAAIEFAGGRTK
jgi:uncharacterized protein